MITITKMFAVLCFIDSTRCSNTVESPPDLGISSLCLRNNRLDFLYSGYLKKEDLSVEDVERAFCLDLNLGDKYDNLIISCLKVIVENNDIKRLSEFLIKGWMAVIDSELVDDPAVDILLSREDYDIFFKNKCNLKKQSRKKISIIISLIYTCFPKINRQYVVDFGKFKFSINHQDSSSEVESLSSEDSDSSQVDEMALQEKHLKNIKKYVKKLEKFVQLQFDLMNRICGKKLYDALADRISEIMSKENPSEYFKLIFESYKTDLAKLILSDDDEED